MLLGVARDAARELAGVTGRRVSVVALAGARVRPGDLRVALPAADRRLGEEGYRLVVIGGGGGGAVRVGAGGVAGARYGLRSVIQLLRQRTTVPAGVARDWPTYPTRGLMVDVGRKVFPVAWLQARIRELADLKLNTLHLHLTDNTGWRLASDRHPEVVSPNALSKDDARGLVAYAARRGVSIVPEIDMPGHMGAALAKHPEWQLRDRSGKPVPGDLDYTIPAARAFARELIEEALPLFPGPVWHMGADEYLSSGVPYVPSVPGLSDAPYPQLLADARARYGPTATAVDGFLGFVNEIDDLVRAHGKTLHVWNDGLAAGRLVRLHPDVTVEWWNDNDAANPAGLVAAGHDVVNAGYWPTYYVLGSPIVPRATAADAYDHWQPTIFRGDKYLSADLALPSHTLPAGEPRNLGSLLHVWADFPDAETPANIATHIAPRLRVMAQKTWGSPPLAADYAGFERVMRAVGEPSTAGR